MKTVELSLSHWGMFEIKPKRRHRLAGWVEQTETLNERLRAQGIEPLYTCGIENGKFWEHRAA